MRSRNAFKNIFSSIGITVVITVIGFLTRKIFLNTLGAEYLGLNGLLSNILGMLSLVEGGIGTSIVYNLYKPLAAKDEIRIIALVQLYKKIYRIIALLVLLLSISIFPFLHYFIKNGENLSYVSLVYFIFVFNSMIGYFMAHKWSLLNTDQKQYKIAGYSLAYQICLNLIKILILTYYKNYVAYLIVESLFGIGYNLIISKVVDQLYPFIKTKISYTVEKATLNNIITNVKALFLHSIGGYLLHSTDNIIISSFIGVTTVGLYSNYTLLCGQVKSLLKPFFAGFKDSVGNLVASESADKQYEVFSVLFLINFWLVSLAVIMLYNTLNPFIKWWLGDQYLLDNSIIIILLINFYVDEIRSSVMTYKYTSGIFSADKYVVFITALLNLTISVVLVQYIGLSGVLLGTAISILFTASWNWPRLVFKHTFHRSVKSYFINWVYYALLTITFTYLTSLICTAFFVDDCSFWSICYRGLTCLLLVNGVYLLLFHRTDQFKYIILVIKQILKR